MAVTKQINQLNDASDISGSDYIPMAQSGQSQATRATVSDLAQVIGELNQSGALSELVLDTSIGKNLLAQKLTEKGIATSPSESLINMANKLENLNVDGKMPYIKVPVVTVSNSSGLYKGIIGKNNYALRLSGSTFSIGQFNSSGTFINEFNVPWPSDFGTGDFCVQFNSTGTTMAIGREVSDGNYQLATFSIDYANSTCTLLYSQSVTTGQTLTALQWGPYVTPDGKKVVLGGATSGNWVDYVYVVDMTTGTATLLGGQPVHNRGNLRCYGCFVNDTTLYYGTSGTSGATYNTSDSSYTPVIKVTYDWSNNTGACTTVGFSFNQYNHPFFNTNMTYNVSMMDIDWETGEAIMSCITQSDSASYDTGIGNPKYPYYLFAFTNIYTNTTHGAVVFFRGFPFWSGSWNSVSWTTPSYSIQAYILSVSNNIIKVYAKNIGYFEYDLVNNIITNREGDSTIYNTMKTGLCSPSFEKITTNDTVYSCSCKFIASDDPNIVLLSSLSSYTGPYNYQMMTGNGTLTKFTTYPVIVGLLWQRNGFAQTMSIPHFYQDAYEADGYADSETKVFLPEDSDESI